MHEKWHDEPRHHTHIIGQQDKNAESMWYHRQDQTAHVLPSQSYRMFYPMTSLKISGEIELWEMCNFPTPSDPHFYGSLYKSENPHPLRNHTILISATGRVQVALGLRPGSSWTMKIALLGIMWFLKEYIFLPWLFSYILVPQEICVLIPHLQHNWEYFCMLF